MDKNFIGPLMIDDLPRYEECFGKIEFPLTDDEEDESVIIHEGKKIPYEMTLSNAYPDNYCCRVMIDGIYYYFG